MTAPTAHLDAARTLGVPVTEISDVADSPAGTIIVTVDGASYVDVPADRPDGDGKTGLMFLAAPKEKYSGSFPVYAAPAENEDEDPKPAKKAADAVVAAVEQSRQLLVERAKELGLKINGRTKTENIVAMIAEAEAKGAGADPMATGGVVDAGTVTVVGESGPELVVPAAGSIVVPTGDSDPGKVEGADGAGDGE